MKLKAGDIVAIRPDLEANSYYDGFKLNELMRLHIAKLTKIEKVNANAYNLVVDTTSCNWSDAMLMKLEVGDYVERKTGRQGNYDEGDVFMIKSFDSAGDVFDPEAEIHCLINLKFVRKASTVLTASTRQRHCDMIVCDEASFTKDWNIGEVNKMELENIKSSNMKEAIKQAKKEKSNEEIEFAKMQYQSATNSINSCDRRIKLIEKEKEPHQKILDAFK